MQSWYDGLNKPKLTPPNKVFWPVWSTLYVLIAIALIVYFRTPVKPHSTTVLVILAAHFAAGFSWTTIFFGKKKILAALFDLLFMDATLAVIIFFFANTNSLAAALLIPYFCWSLLATWLNFGIWRLNPGKR
jgi:translocator protein